MIKILRLPLAVALLLATAYVVASNHPSTNQPTTCPPVTAPEPTDG